MIWEKNIKLILMSCELTDNDYSSKCYHYWPKIPSCFSSKELTMNNGLKLRAIKEKNITKNLTERNFSLTNTINNEKKEVTQLHFRKWPDHGVPDLVETFETFEKINEKLNEHFSNYKSESPVLVHCLAGVGRTGTIISIFQINYIAKKHLAMKLNLMNFNIFNIARRLKEQRRYSIQTANQYELIYKYSYILLKKLSLEFRK